MKASEPRAPSRLRCESIENPLGLDEPHPRLSWWVNDSRRGARSTAYQIVADNGWDTGKRDGGENAGIEYRGPALKSRERVVWKVRTWDAAGKASPWSAPAWWEMGLLRREEWQAEWIGSALVGGPRRQAPAPLLRREFCLDRPVARARLYATALGLYEFRINGRPVSREVFRPGWTDYTRRIPYQVYDVTRLLRRGGNALAAVLGDGWYCGYVAWFPRQNYGDRPKLLARVEIDLTDGSAMRVVSDGSWKWSAGPIVESDILMGERCDARRELPGWDRPGFRDRAWPTARVFAPPSAALVAQSSPPVRPIEELRPIAVRATRSAKRWIFDLGQNMVGRARLRMRGAPGRTVRLRFGEMLQANGELYTENLRTARSTDHYTFRSDRVETWEPKFTFHGFRYVELDGHRGRPPRGTVTGVVLHSDTPPTGTFRCSDPLLNRLQNNIRWGQKGNFLEVPTDCPQRNERLGWMGDAQVFVRTAAFNMDVAAFFAKWQQDIADAQTADGKFPKFAPVVVAKNEEGGPAWADAGVICPWTMYLCYGDRRILERHYASMARFVAWMKRNSLGGIRAAEDFQGFHGYGDWLAIDAPNRHDSPTPKALIGTAYFARCADLMARIARVLGKRRDARNYARLAKRIKAAFNREFVTPAGRVVGNTQTGNLLALGFDLLPSGRRKAALKHLLHKLGQSRWHLSTGFVGTPFLAPVLTRFGRADAAWRVVKQETYPGWLYTVKQGATTMWERWNSWTKEHGFGPVEMNSFNHYAYGAIGEWLYGTVGGIAPDPAGPGYARLLVHPRPGGGVVWAEASLDTVRGRVESAWKIGGGRFVLSLRIPPGAVAEVVFPSRDPRRTRESGRRISARRGIRRARTSGGMFACEIGAGAYRFETPWRRGEESGG